jgi:undecaprenyl-diphosphatase
MNYIQALILGIIEGITEFLPVSSTGHMIVGSSIMGIDKDDFVKLFEIVIQLGAIISVIVVYWRKFFPLNHWKFYLKLIIAVIPALILGALFSNKIDDFLESSSIVALTLIVGGIILIFIDRVFQHPTIEHEKEVTNKNGFVIGIWQCLAMIPGVSRSAASIIGGMQQKLTRKVATEFSFFLAVPTMCAATGYKILKAFQKTPEMLKDAHNLKLLLLGNAVAFVVAIVAIKFFISIVQKFGFKFFGWYRVLAGIVIIILISKGIIIDDKFHFFDFLKK